MMGIMTTVKRDEMMPEAMLKRPRCHGPRRKRLPTKKVLMKMGIVKAM